MHPTKWEEFNSSSLREWIDHNLEDVHMGRFEKYEWLIIFQLVTYLA